MDSNLRNDKIPINNKFIINLKNTGMVSDGILRSNQKVEEMNSMLPYYPLSFRTKMNIGESQICLDSIVYSSYPDIYRNSHCSSIYNYGNHFTRAFKFSANNRSTRIVFNGEMLLLKMPDQVDGTVVLGALMARKEAADKLIKETNMDYTSTSTLLEINKSDIIFMYDEKLIESNLSKSGRTKMNRFIGEIKLYGIELSNVSGIHSKLVRGVKLKARSAAKLRSLKRKIIKECL